MYQGLHISGSSTSPALIMTGQRLADGDAGANQTVDAMRGLVDLALKDPQIYALARQLVAGVPAYNDPQEVQTVYQWVQAHIRFVKGVLGKQSLQTAESTLALRAGQCTDLSVLLTALLMSIGYPVRFVAISTDPGAPDQLSHIYPEVELAGYWVSADAARENAAFGQSPRNLGRRETFNILDNWGNMPHLGQDAASEAQALVNELPQLEAGAAQIVAAAQGPYVYLPGEGNVLNPAYPGNPQSVLQNPSQALGLPGWILLGFAGWLVYKLVVK